MKGAGNFLPEIFVSAAANTESDLQLAKTPMSPCESFGTFEEALLADWSPKERCGKLLTRNFRFRCSKHRERLAIGQNTDVTLRIIRNIRGSIVSGLVRERNVRATSYLKFR
jgi:hypothetical protein